MHDIISISWMPQREEEVMQWSVTDGPKGLGLNGAEHLRPPTDRYITTTNMLSFLLPK